MASFKFCRNCNNLLYPKENRDIEDITARRLLYSCRNCDYTELSDNPKIYRNELITHIGETAGVVQDIGNDPTLPRSNKECPNCLNHECVFFQSQQRRKDTSMILFYVCLSCNSLFR
ncbi:DNA-directed RNA polymerase II core subunit RPB9 ASCRUDRAFT_16340, partial [Ascoidea rubescens DSM 1968]